MSTVVMSLRLIEAPERMLARNQVEACGAGKVRGWHVIRVESERWDTVEIQEFTAIGVDWTIPRWKVQIAFEARDQRELDFALEVVELALEKFCGDSRYLPAQDLDKELLDDIISGDPGAMLSGLNQSAETLKAAATAQVPMADFQTALLRIDGYTKSLRRRKG